MSANKQYQHTKELLKFAQKYLTYEENITLHKIIDKYVNSRIQRLSYIKRSIDSNY